MPNIRIALNIDTLPNKNKIKYFTEYINYYYNVLQKENTYHNTDISFSPDVVGFAGINFIPVKNGEINFQSKYVGRQFLDNTSHISRSIDPYFVENIRFSYTLYKKIFKVINFVFQVVSNRHFAEKEILDAIEKGEKEMLFSSSIMFSIKCMNRMAILIIIFPMEILQ